MLGLLIPCDGNVITLQDFEEPLYKSIGAVVGGFIEIVHIKLENYEDNNLVLVVNDEGLWQGLAVNDVASFMYGHTIVGNAVVMKEGIVNGEPDLIGLEPSEGFDILLATLVQTINSEEIEDV